MAHANVQIETVKTITGVTLALSLEEAQIIHSALGSIGGRGEARRKSDAVYNALGKALGEHNTTYNTDHPFYLKRSSSAYGYPYFVNCDESF